mgnify:CR=1 FL=1
MVVKRPKLSLAERLYLPAIVTGLAITLKHLKKLVSGKTKVTMQYPGAALGLAASSWYRGAPGIGEGRARQGSLRGLPALRIHLSPAGNHHRARRNSPSDRWAKVEKRPKEFEIDMIRCIYCGLCEEVCPEQAIFLKKEYSITGYTRQEMMHDKEKLYEMGGVMEGLVYKWNEKK